jgi:hypothetical protein
MFVQVRFEYQHKVVMGSASLVRVPAHKVVMGSASLVRVPAHKVGSASESRIFVCILVLRVCIKYDER